MALGDVIARLAVTLSLDASEFATGSTKAQRDMGRLQASFRALGEKWTQTGKRLSIGITAPLAAFGIASAKTASDAAELQSAFNQTFDDLSGTMNRWAQTTGDAMGRSTQSIQEMANTFGIFFNQAAPTRKEAAEMSKTFTVLAQDLSSFFNVSGDVALQKLRSGLAGESEPLRDFGVFLNAASVEAKSMELGLADASGEISEQAKILARYNLIMEATTEAQGDVARTAGGTANQTRAFMEALEELRVVIGERLLPVITPLIKGVTSVLNGFNNLPGPVQTAVVAFGALAASIGPMMLIMGTLAATILPLFAAKFGIVGIAISAFINPIGTAISFLAAFAAKIGGLTILKAIGALLLRFAGPIGLIASIGLLLYKNWEQISAVFADFWAAAKQALGPPIQELVATLKGLFDELWQGPLGDGIRVAMGFLAEFAEVVGSVFGQAVIATLKAFLDAIIFVLETLGDAIRIVNALLNGDWRGAWDAAISIVNRIAAPFTKIANLVVSLAQQMFQGVKNWLQDKLGGVFRWLADKLGYVGDLFFKLYDRVVGNSYVPDMVDGIRDQMARLDAVMVDPARRATQSTEDAFREMAGNVRQLLDELYPEIARVNDFNSKLGLIDGSGLTDAQKANAAGRLRGQALGNDGKLDVRAASFPFLPDPAEMQATMDRIGKIIVDGLQKTKSAWEGFKEFGADAFRSIAYQIEGFLVGAQSAVDALRNIVAELASQAFRQFIVAPLGASLGIPGFASGTNFAPGGLALVGERGPELVNLPRGSQVVPNHELGGMGGMQQTNHFSFPGITNAREARMAEGQIALRLRQQMNGPLRRG